MENKLEEKINSHLILRGLSSNKKIQNNFLSETNLLEKEKTSNLKTIKQFGDRFIISDEFPGVYYYGVQYYDLKNIRFINSTGLANLIELLKSLLKKGVEVQFVNVNDKIKNKIKIMGLEDILNCA